MQFHKDNLGSAEVADLVREHLYSAHEHSPPESAHALDLDALRSPDITFWTVWYGQELLGCGALKELNKKHGEIKSMRTKGARRGKGVASKMLEYIIKESERRSYDRLNLETGSMDSFAPARALYAPFGFEYQGPFADYKDDPNSVFMTLNL